MKKKVLLSLDPEVVELLEKGSKELGINKSQFITRLLKDNVENRLSKHIVRDIENLLLYLILQNDNQKQINKNEIMQKLDFIYKQTTAVKSAKALLLKEEREKKKNELKAFWHKVLELLEPNNFKKNILNKDGKYNPEKAKKYLKQLHNLIKENKNLGS